MADEPLAIGECVCMSAYTELLGELGVPEGYGALIISCKPDSLTKIGALLFKDVAVVIANRPNEEVAPSHNAGEGQ